MVTEQLHLRLTKKLVVEIKVEAERYELNAQNWIKMIIAKELKKVKGE